ncbi:glutathione hydrolase 5 proenzyme-like [Colossoma macropomum]|uniref:glutathione hydrolase 5 proenzyme-like n=1 Tax=Colossoma macropomum TaxID=42526 RepID=UPI001864BFFA|nr:glutathione hydrolase 5 proenzyme-like [Colossoma macropomum]
MANWKKICIFFTFSLLICICIAVVVTVLRPYKAVVAADSKICSEVGRDILKEGGSAADAAIAALLCTSVVNPLSMGIGGGSIFTIMSKNGSVKIINSRETVPKAVKEDLLSDCPCSETGGIVWMGVPGEIRGYERVHRLYGRLPWSRLFQPTIRLAREGVKMSKTVARYLHVIRNRGARQLFEDEKGRMLKEGDTMKFEELADTLEEIAENGADEFYTGETAEKLLCDMQRAGGSITLEDLRSVAVSELEPWKVSLGDYTMYFPPPPSGASVVSFILNVMEGYNLNPASLEGKERVLTYHRYVEASKFANAQRKLMKDPRFNDVKKAYAITEKEFADHIRKMITDDRTHDNQYYNVTPEVDTQGTTHVSVLDEDGMAVSVTSTINYMFGCGEFSPQTGVIFNNQLADFCHRADKIQTGERPPSSMAPMILRSTKTDDLIIIGASGGTMITTGVTMALMNYLWFGNSLKHSIAEPVVFVDSKNRLSFETDFDEEVIEALKDRKDTVKYKKYFYNVVNAISKRGGTIYAYSDNRKDGEAAGY